MPPILHGPPPIPALVAPQGYVLVPQAQWAELTGAALAGQPIATPLRPVRTTRSVLRWGFTLLTLVLLLACGGETLSLARDFQGGGGGGATAATTVTAARPSPTTAPTAAPFVPGKTIPYVPHGPYWQGTIVVANTSGHSPWNGYVLLRDASGDTCANAPFQGGLFQVSLGPADAAPGRPDTHSTRISCMLPMGTGAPPPAHAFTGTWPSSWPTGTALFAAIDNPAPFTLQQL